jgi:hypothetical protein
MRALTLRMLSFFIALCAWPSHVGVASHNSPLISCRKYDEYGLLSYEEEKPRLDYYAGQLKDEPGAVAIIIVHPGGKLSFQESQVRARQAIDYLVNERDVDPEHIGVITLKKSQQEFVTELWICPYFPPEKLRHMFEGIALTGKEVQKKTH